MADRLGFEVFAADKASANLARAGKSMKALAADVEIANVRMERATKAADAAVEKYGRDSLQAREALARLAKAEDAAEVTARKLAVAQRVAAAATEEAGEQAEQAEGKWDKLAAAVDELNAKKLKVDVDIVKATQSLDRLKQLADGATGDRKIRYDAEIAAAEAKIRVLQNRSDELRETIRIKVEVDGDPSAFRRISDFAKDPAFRGGLASGLRASLVVAAVGAAAAVTPVISAGIVAGGTLGMVGLAAQLQKDDPKLAAAGRSLGDTFTVGFRQASAGMASPMTDALGIFQRELTADLPMIQRAFDAAAGAVEPLAAGLAGAAHNALPGFVSALQSAQPVIDVLAAELPELGTAVGDMLKTAAAMAPYAADALKVFFEVAEAGTQVMRGLMVSAVLMDQVLLRQPKSWQALKDAYNGVDPDLSGLTGKFNELTTASSKTAGALNETANALLRERGSVVGFWTAVDSATEAVKRNGRTLDIHTEAGRQNRTALDQVAASSLAVRDAAVAHGASEEHLIEITELGRQKFIATARQMGMNATAAQNLANEYFGIPADVNTATHLDKAQAQARAQDYKGVLWAVPRSVNTRAQFDSGAARAGLASYRLQLDRIDGRVVRAYVKTDYSGSIQAPAGIRAARAEGGILPGRPSRRDNMVIAAATGEYVVNSAATARHRATLEAINSGRFRGYAAGGYVGASAVSARSVTQVVHRVQLEWVGGNAGDGFMTWLQKNIRTRGGVTAALEG